MKMICFLLCLFFVQPQIAPMPTGTSGGVTKCEDLKRLITNCEFAIKEAEKAIVDLKDKKAQNDLQIQALIKALADELAKPIPSVFITNGYKTNLYRLITTNNKIDFDIKELEFKISGLKSSIDEYKKQYTQNGC